MSRQPKLAKDICKLLASNHLLSVSEIVSCLNSHDKSCNKTSVYRALDKLMAADIICKQSFGSEAKFELREDHHDHVVCNECNKIEAIECSFDKHSVDGFKIDHHHTVVYGICEGCS
jgi:Fe2+ or Zn2+ uptake regulation protein